MKKIITTTTALLFVSVLLPVLASGKAKKKDVLKSIQKKEENYHKIAKQIWTWAEAGYQEYKSSELLQKTLRDEDFSIEMGVAEIPTAFVASYGSGKPIIGILAEFDALPGLSQEASPVRKPRVEGASGHACGHHLFGTASTAAAIAVKEWMKKTGTIGTLRLYGTPAEEGGSGKVYMVRAGLFDDVDAVLHWHASDRNDASPATTLANRSAKFRFSGYSSHAAGAPERGRSALDGIEAMNYMVNLMREHVPQETRIHYVITRGGDAPNVVPDFAETFYYVRHPRVDVLEELWDRVLKTAEGAALGTGTALDFEIIHGNRPVLRNDVLQKVVYDNLKEVGGVKYNREERKFAEAIQETFRKITMPIESASEIQSWEFRPGRGSTDVGDISWMVPTAGLNVATWVPGTSAHTWQAVAAGGMGIGMKGLTVAAKILALSAMDYYQNPDIIKKAKFELEERRGPNFDYYALLGDRDPPLDYRN
ncbi:MAG: amidohydrolase [Candidatus Neomarinimicrobiota bacterium]|nr:amidohydrolase [Candidatus Neomarinimicrobiota bacterium]